MADSRELAAMVAANTEELTNEEFAKGRNYMVPPPPKPGEYIYCIHCGKAMLPEDFSKDPKIRKHEFKWHIHWECEQKIWELADRQTPGLIADRKQGYNLKKPVSLGRK